MKQTSDRRLHAALVESCPRQGRIAHVFKRFLPAALALFPLCVNADFTGSIIGITDGDTVTVLHGGVPIKIRLAGVDTLESHGQAFGIVSKQNLSRLLFKRTVRVEEQTVDRYGRTVAFIGSADPDCRAASCPLTFDVNLRQVTDGMAWHYVQYLPVRSPRGMAYSMAERNARTEKRGLWVDLAPEPPWSWRKEARDASGR